MVGSSTVFKYSLVIGCILSLLPLSQGAWRNLVSSWTDSGAQWTGRTTTSAAVFHFGPVRLWTQAINSGHYEITSRVYSNSGFGCGHMFKYKTGSTRTRSLVTKAWGYYLSYGNSIKISTTGIEYSPSISYSYPTNQWNNLRTVVQGTKVTMYINGKLVKQVNMQGTGASSSSNNYVGLWCHSSTSERGRDFHVRDFLGTRVTCAPNHIQISLPKARLPGVLVQDLQLLDPSCRATENSTHFYLKTLFNQCGTVTNKTSSSITYTNKVIERPLAKNATITRIRELEISFTCSYSRRKELLMSRFQPHRNKLIFNKHVRGNFSFSFRFYPNSSFNNPYGNISVPVRLRQPMFFEVSVKSQNRELGVFARDCYATPFKSVTRPKHWLIKNGCLVDSTLKALNTSSPSVQRFSFQAFRFVGNYRHLYFHCHVTACNGNDVKSVCARGCVKGKPVKREEKGQRIRLIQGPFTLKKGTI